MLVYELDDIELCKLFLQPLSVVYIEIIDDVVIYVDAVFQ